MRLFVCWKEMVNSSVPTIKVFQIHITARVLSDLYFFLCFQGAQGQSLPHYGVVTDGNYKQDVSFQL